MPKPGFIPNTACLVLHDGPCPGYPHPTEQGEAVERIIERNKKMTGDTMKIGQKVTVTDGTYDTVGYIEGLDSVEEGYVLRVLITPETLERQ